MELKPRAIEHWDAFNEYRDSVTLYQIGDVYMVELEDCFSFNGGKKIHYWSTQAEAQTEIDRIKKKWSSEYKQRK
jgi:hypothetical protein